MPGHQKVEKNQSTSKEKSKFPQWSVTNDPLEISDEEIEFLENSEGKPVKLDVLAGNNKNKRKKTKLKKSFVKK